MVDAHAALVAFAGFGDPPSSVWQAPAYAVRVTLRRRVLIDGLRRARARGSRDAGVYEAALRTANDAVIRNGVLVVATMTALAGMLLFAAARVLSVLDIHL